MSRATEAKRTVLCTTEPPQRRLPEGDPVQLHGGLVLPERRCEAAQGGARHRPLQQRRARPISGTVRDCC